jgi:hypothetical protein
LLAGAEGFGQPRTTLKGPDKQGQYTVVMEGVDIYDPVSTVENYEYGFFWYFYQDGSIQLEVKPTGVLSLGALRPGEKAKYGALVAPQLYAPVHQHFFNVRLDFALDGVNNSVYRVDVVPDEPGPANPHGNAFSAKATPLKTEKQARDHLKLETARTWRVVNPNVLNAVGEPVGYRFVPMDNSVPMAGPDAWWRKRAGFVNYQVWVTPFDEAERFAAGDYSNQSRGGDGLVKWTEKDRPIENTDVVLVHLRPHSHPAAGGLPGDAGGVHRVPAEAERVFRDEPGERPPAVAEEGCGDGVVLPRVIVRPTARLSGRRGRGTLTPQTVRGISAPIFCVRVAFRVRRG